MTRALRAVAVLIAIAGAIDPAVTVTGSVRPRLAVVALDQSSAADRVRTQLSRDLGGDFEIVPAATSDASAAIVIGRSYLSNSTELSRFGRMISTVTTAPPDVAIASVSAPRAVPPATAIHVEADVDARNAGGATDLVARIGGIEVARASHRWTREGERWRAGLDLPPFGDAPFVIHLDAGSASADVAVERRQAPIRVLVRDARPSWASTFTRRALEADPRFDVQSSVVSSRGIVARTAGGAALTDANVDRFDALIVGGLDALTAADVRALDQYMRARGGAVVLVPDQKVSGAAADLLLDAAERLLERPATLAMRAAAPALQATELLLPIHVGAGSDVVAAMPGGEGAPVIVSAPRGAGRLLMSGAMDAWRFRAANERAFDRFWQATIAGLALAAPPLVDITVTPSPLETGERAAVVVRARRAAASARFTASVDHRPIRLWPDAEPGTYRGEFVADMTPRVSRVQVDVADGIERSAAADIPVRSSVRHASDPMLAPLAMLASAHGGVDAAPERVADLERFVRASVKPGRAPRSVRPMRSAWWIPPFAACLAGEWWLRRRAGRR
jgi:hypothetical protein